MILALITIIIYTPLYLFCYFACMDVSEVDACPPILVFISCLAFMNVFVKQIKINAKYILPISSQHHLRFTFYQYVSCITILLF